MRMRTSSSVARLQGEDEKRVRIHAGSLEARDGSGHVCDDDRRTALLCPKVAGNRSSRRDAEAPVERGGGPFRKFIVHTLNDENRPELVAIDLQLRY